jgi:amino acid transporter
MSIATRAPDHRQYSVATIAEPASGTPPWAVVKRLLVGPAMATHRLEHTLLPKVLALPVFSSDPLSSVAYATEEMMHVLLAVSVAATTLIMPISFAIALLLLIVVVSYRQTVQAYPSGGGAYIVSRENLGTPAGLVAAAALLIDYVLTVSVSVVAGVFAITSAVPGLSDRKVALSVGFVVFITLANLRGVRESGTLFAIPTYGFVISIFILLSTGLTRCLFSGCPEAAVPEATIHVGAAATVPLFVILHAFSSGSTALTGVEAISNGVPAFRRPQARNASTTLAIMGAFSISMFLGISFLAQRSGALPSDEKSVVAQIAGGVFGEGLLFYVVQVFTAAILILAANTAYQDFPRLSSILARDGFMPKQFENRGDRLVFSNGVIVLAVVASLLIYAFGADLSRLIQLYVVGVFTSFTLSQAGMVRHWIKLQRAGKGPRNWHRSIVINAVGALTTCVVLAVVVQTKFKHGAWIVITAMPFIVAGFYALHRHYEWVADERRRGAWTLGEQGKNVVLLYVEALNEATAEAVGYIRSFCGNDFQAIHVPKERDSGDIAAKWQSFSRSEAPLKVLSARKAPVDAVINHVRSIPRGPDDFVNVVIPELMKSKSLIGALRTPTFLLKLRLLREPQIVVTDVPVLNEGDRPVGVDARPFVPNRVEVILFVGSVHDGVIRAINYARSLRASDIRAVYFAFEPSRVESIQQQWSDYRIPIRLDIVEAPFRDLGPPILEEVRSVTSRPDAVASVVMPELVPTRWWHRLLHNQRALFVKRLLLFEPRVVLSSVPYQLGATTRRPGERRPVLPGFGVRPPSLDASK